MGRILLCSSDSSRPRCCCPPTEAHVRDVQGAVVGKPSRVLTSAAGIEVKQTLQLPGHPEVFAIGDIAVFTDESGRRLPMLAPVAIQEGERAAENIRRMLARKDPLPFAYRDKGIMATIGRHAAVV